MRSISRLIILSTSTSRGSTRFQSFLHSFSLMISQVEITGHMPFGNNQRMAGRYGITIIKTPHKWPFHKLLPPSGKDGRKDNAPPPFAPAD